MSGSGTLPVSKVWDTVVMCARKGRRKIGGRIDRVSSRERRNV